EINFAMHNIHFPKDASCYEQARKRFMFEELFLLQLTLLEKRTADKNAKRTPFSDIACYREFIKTLPFALTGAQLRAVEEICSDFSKPVPMNRLLQGDVGSGKTVVAAAAIYVAYKNNFRSAVMAPTEILATQLYSTFCEFFKNTGIKAVLLTGGTKEKQQIYNRIKCGDYHVIIGTNAIIQKDVDYCNLGLVIADEQHRFGVSQRAELANKGENPNVLIMTATPIPRTLSLILYGDLDISVINEMPPGRKPVLTYAVGENMRQRVYTFLDKHIKTGSQAYVVCPLIEESEKSDLSNAVDLYSRLSETFPSFSVGLIHGKMKPTEKEEVMHEFLENKIQILVSTTVIEVGVNVPNSNIMIIENAERFGLSTLHQLRGRVGRGMDQAYCIMFAHGSNEITRKRMETLCKSNDGFFISEQDLKLRGPGDYFGTRQHGLPKMKIANLFTDAEVLKIAQEAAKDVLDGEIEITEKENRLLSEKTENILHNSIVLN
ncbi:MAG: ATP-dependent DNA helicase RecG, partial [Clostridiales bacterium]|nr:ATP-dependent DNA helicase RecG [Clostridiales bacterium]